MLLDLGAKRVVCTWPGLGVGFVPLRASLLWHAGNKGCSGAWGARPVSSVLELRSMSDTCGWVLGADWGQGPDGIGSGPLGTRLETTLDKFMLVWSQRHTVPVREELRSGLLGKLRSRSPFYLMARSSLFHFLYVFMNMYVFVCAQSCMHVCSVVCRGWRSW